MFHKNGLMQISGKMHQHSIMGIEMSVFENLLHLYLYYVENINNIHIFFYVDRWIISFTVFIAHKNLSLAYSVQNLSPI